MPRKGATRGKGSSTRIFNHCKRNTSNPCLCINQFIKITPNNSKIPDEIEYYSEIFAQQYNQFTDSFDSLVIKYNI